MSIRVENSLVATDSSDGLVSIRVGDQTFGVPVLSVQDVLGAQRLTRIPLAPQEVAGALNLRGRIVTAIDLKKRLGLAGGEDAQVGMSIVVEHGNELYSLLIDQVGEVLSLPAERYEANPPTLDPRWREVSGGIYRLDGQLLVILEVERVLDFARAQAA